MPFDELSVRRQIVGFHDEIYSCALLDKEESTWLFHQIPKKFVCTTLKLGIVNLLKVTTTVYCALQQLLSIVVYLPRQAKMAQLFCGFFNIRKLACSSTFVAHGKEVTSVDVSLSDSVCITGGLDKMVKLWHIDEVKMRLGIAGTLSGHRRGVGDVKFSPNSLKAASSSGDMTIKIWSLSEKSCLQTLNGHNSAVFRILFVNRAHTDKIWTLLANNNESEYVTAGADGSIVIWKDVSGDRKQEEDLKLRKHMEEEQTLNNLLEQDRLQEALEYALGLVRPFCALKVIDRLIDCEELFSALVKLDYQRLQTLLDFVTQWNTRSKTSLTSQNVLNCLLRILPPEKLLELPNIASVLESLIPYTRRHMERLNNSRREVSLLNFTWNQMRLN
ncbi:hypothetical protein KIN20_027685 [Parelaphostrongylus tenuis]|uniref:U3 small nucleolar RNA-associated protein 13 C-terminal domain-containing protein n=1 Tax=Parelaphostrongylus tenuis TaxID=148309 RepID=A0AAD5QZP3_PARTN|nr:hypothetical protein KIN20_027685 [Parelaphostrongylus tenuis]